MATYDENQQVTFKGNVMPATIISGPHKTYGADRWLIRKADGAVTLARGSELSAVRSQREEIAAVAYSAANFGAQWPPISHTIRTSYLRIADAVLAELKAEPEKPAKRPLRTGDRIRILRRGLSSAEVDRGDVLPVIAVDPLEFRVRTHKLSRGYYIFKLADEGTGWERV
ncbi:hypothetical protein ACIGPN_06005 [Streptomyces afghaniensis]|uniref:hypothetical protein n=1 Tax=Streptomyces afghaniensis TaxID=66865 RepID=UPI0037D52D13